MNSLGNYQLGDWIPFYLQCRDSSRTPVAPTAQPTAKVYTSGGTLKATVNLPVARKKTVDVGFFGCAHRLSSLYATGNYVVIYEYAHGGNTYRKTDMFSVVGGGNSNGNVVASYTLTRPEATYVVFQDDDGTVYQGRGPS